MKEKILIVDDEPQVCESMQVMLERDHAVLTATSGRRALEIMRREEVGLVFLDVKMPGMDGIEALKRIKKQDPGVEVIMITGHKEVDLAVRSFRGGAYHYVFKPVRLEVLKHIIEEIGRKRTLRRQADLLFSERRSSTAKNKLVYCSPAMRRMMAVVKRVAAKDVTVLLTGETGTGKDLLATTIHSISKRKDAPFVAVDCGALSQTLIESELFGHEKGAFTGADKRRLGKFELAQGGTIFLDEVTNLSHNAQATLLRVLEERELARVGGEKAVSIDVRLISASNIDLRAEVKEGKFRRDLLYRLNVVHIAIPPLREREGDVQRLAAYFLGIYATKHGKPRLAFSRKAIKALKKYDWPGNVRELRNVVEKMVVATDGNEISCEHMPLEVFLRDIPATQQSGGEKLSDFHEELDRRVLSAFLRKYDNNAIRVAAALGIHRNTLSKKMKELGMK